VFLVQVTLDTTGPQSNARVVLSGGASGSRDYTLMAPLQPLSHQFAAIRIWQGFPHTGRFFSTEIVVSQEP
jgi:hypothetical protein